MFTLDVSLFILRGVPRALISSSDIPSGIYYFSVPPIVMVALLRVFLSDIDEQTVSGLFRFGFIFWVAYLW